MTYRPWGQLDWLVGRTAPNWSLLSCVSAEERSTSVHNMLAAGGHLQQSWMLEIKDPDSRFSARNEMLRTANRVRLLNGPFNLSVSESDLLASDAEIVCHLQAVDTSGVENLICDISCMPKRYFFPLIKLLLKRPRLRNLCISYTVPEKYHDGTLAEDHGPLQCLPLFGPRGFDDQVDVAVIGVGFVPLGLASLLEPYKDSTPVELILPFPPGPPFYQRNWQFIQEIRHTLADQGSDPHRLHAIDMSSAFDHIKALCSSGIKRAAFAPYGPKPISLAMCLYASLTDCPVYYTQPKVYHPEYSSGVAMIDGNPNINAYALRLDGIDFYSI